MHECFHSTSFKLDAIGGIGHGQQHVNPLGGAGHFPGDVQATWDQRVLEFPHFFGECCDTRIGIACGQGIPLRLAPDQVEFKCL